MRKNILYLILVIPGLVIVIFLFRVPIGSIFSADYDFKIADTASVDRIEIISKDSIILSKNESGWMVNGDAPASRIAVSNFLFSFSRMSVKGASINYDINESNSLRVKIISKREKLSLRFHDKDGAAFMYKEGSGKLYAVEVNGFPDIKLEEVISPDIDFWKDKTLLNLKPSEIAEISVLHPSHSEEDFAIKVKEGKIQLFDGEGNEIPENLTDKEKLNFYMSYFTNVFYDSTENNTEIPDLKSKWILKVQDNAGRKYVLTVFPVETKEGPDLYSALVKTDAMPGYKHTRFIVLDLLLQDKNHFLLKEFTHTESK
jgi:hypothetical protein